jgi:NAD(P)-dependent dehydrogenase (short-subunit alcohol dehydrogenase family)
VAGAPNHSAYGAAKAGLIHLTKTLAVEYGRSGIRVNAVSPGAVATPATESTMSAERRATLAAATPLQRPGRPDDIARAVLYFASPMSDYVTGQMLLVDGGIGAKFPLGGVGTHASEAALPTELRP